MAKRANGEGTVRQRSNGTWEARLTYIDPQTGRQERRSFYGKTAREVRSKMKAARERIEAGAPVVDDKQTIAMWMKHWRETTLAASSLAESTKTQYGHLSRSYLETEPFGSITLDRLKPSDVDALILAMRGKKLADSTIRSTFTVLRKAVADAVRDGLLARNPVALVKRPKVERTVQRHLSRAEVTDVLRCAEGMRYHLALMLIAVTGLRRGEALGLTWESVDLERGELRVASTLSRINGELAVSTPKTAQSRRTVPLSEAVVTMLRRHKAAQAAERLRAANVWKDHGLVFCTVTGTPVDPRNLLREVQTAASRAGIDDVGVHSLRHAAATAWVESGTHLRAVADLLGHSSTAFTADTYIATAESVARSAVDRLSNDIISM